MTELVICRGIPASGKTAWARTWVAEAPESRARVNRDDLRDLLYGREAGNPLPYRLEQAVTAAEASAVEGLLAAGRSVVVDDTNLRAANARALAQVGLRGGASVRFEDFPISVDDALERDRVRAIWGGRSAGEEAIRSFAARFTKANGLKLPPTPSLGFEATRRYVPETRLPTAWLFDVDGTLAHMNGRGPFEWHRVGEDSADVAVFDVMHALRDRGHDIVVLSGRDGSCREATAAWLEAELTGASENLLMRAAGDTRKDAVVKDEIFWRDVAPRWCVLGVFDDRDQVVAMWRALGLKCFQVAPGAF